MALKSEELYRSLYEQLANTSGTVSLQERFRALFSLKNLADDRSVEIIASCFHDDSVLLKHELAYVLGQMGLKSAVPRLVELLNDAQQDPMVRHEAGEALGAIGDASCTPELQKYAYNHGGSDVIRETCILALDRIAQLNDPTSLDYAVLVSGPRTDLPFVSVDPAPADETTSSISELEIKLLDSHRSLYDRYKAMFKLRNLAAGDDAATATAAVLSLGQAIGAEGTSALFRHEVAYVLGQVSHPASVPALAMALGRKDEAAMVRHECAEALGAVATPEAMSVLAAHLHDSERVVKESILVALDVLAYENDPTQFQYAALASAPRVKSLKESAHSA